MNHIHIKTRGASDWRSRLAKPDEHWKRGASAMETAVSWEGAGKSHGGLPQPIHRAFLSSELGKAELLFAVAEHKVPLEGTGGASQCDVWALVRTQLGWASLSVEAKAKEPFGKEDQPLSKWLNEGKSSGSAFNRQNRWEHVSKNLPRMKTGAYDAVPFQILHRCAAAVIEARRFQIKHAVFLVQAFDAPAESFEKYAIFATALGLPAIKERLDFTAVDETLLGIGWVDCAMASAKEVVNAFVGCRHSASNADP